MTTSLAPARSTLPIAIVGGGITGLTAAFALTRAGRQVRLFEASGRLGGSIQTHRESGWLSEAGPNSLLLGDATVLKVLEDLGVRHDLVRANPTARNRYIVRGGKPLAAPAGPGSFFSTRLFSTRAKLRLGVELFRRQRHRTSDVSLALFAEAHFGREILTYGVQPFVSGIYAGNPAKLSTRYAFPQLWDAEQRSGSVIRGFIAAAKERKARGESRGGIASFPQGLQHLTDTLAATLPRHAVELHAPVETLIPDGTWKLVWSRDGQATTERFSAVLLATPADTLAHLPFGTLGERPLAALEAVESPPVVSLFLGFRREQVEHPLDGFGALVPEVERRSILGVLFSSSLFPGRAPEGHVALTVLMGGVLRPDLGRLGEAEATRTALNELGLLFGVRGEPVHARYRAWPRAIPQYNLGHERFLDAINRAEATHPGLLIGGNTRDGVSLPACIKSGLRLAERATALA